MIFPAVSSRYSELDFKGSYLKVSSKVLLVQKIDYYKGSIFLGEKRADVLKVSTESCPSHVKHLLHNLVVPGDPQKFSQQITVPFGVKLRRRISVITCCLTDSESLLKSYVTGSRALRRAQCITIVCGLPCYEF